MGSFLIIILMIVAVLLIIIVLLQPGKGDIASSLGGLSGQFSSVLGTRRAADLLMKLTIGFAATIMLLSLVVNLAFVGGKEDRPKAPTEGVSLPVSTPNPLQANPPTPKPLPQKKK